MKWMMSLALLASVAAPALAQDGGPRDGGDHGHDRGGNHDAGRPPRPQGAQNGQRQQGPQGQQGPHGGGPDQGQRPSFQQGGQQGGPQHGPQDGRGPGGRFDGPGRMPGGGQPGGVQVHRGDVRQPGQWDGGRPNSGPGGRPDWHGGPGGPGGRPGSAGGPGGDQRGGGWNRGWRDDHRYDWQGWRDTHRSFYHVGGYRPPYGFGGGYRRFGVGGRIDPVFFGQDYWISDPWYYRLPPANGPFRWVRYYNDALLINVYDGMVADEIPDFFW